MNISQCVCYIDLEYGAKSNYVQLVTSDPHKYNHESHGVHSFGLRRSNTDVDQYAAPLTRTADIFSPKANGVCPV